MNALDVVDLPYEQSLSSSNAVMALSFGKRVLLPESAWSSDLAAALGANVVRLYRPPLERADLESSLINPVDPGEVLDPVRVALDWEIIATRTLALYSWIPGRAVENP